MTALLEHSHDIGRLVDAGRGLQLASVRELHVRAHVVGAETQADLQVFVAKNLLLIAEYGISEARVEGGNGLDARVGWRNEADAERIV